MLYWICKLGDCSVVPPNKVYDEVVGLHPGIGRKSTVQLKLFVPHNGVLVVPVAVTESLTQSVVFVSAKSAVGSGFTQMVRVIVSIPQSVPLPTAKRILY